MVRDLIDRLSASPSTKTWHEPTGSTRDRARISRAWRRSMIADARRLWVEVQSEGDSDEPARR